MLTRREFGMLAATGLGLKWGAVFSAQTPAGVRLGAQTYSFRDIPRGADGDGVAPVIAAMTACGLKECELWAPQVEPAGLSREAIRAWRLETPLGSLPRGQEPLRRRRHFDLRIQLQPEQELHRSRNRPRIRDGESAGAEIITASTTLDVAPRIKPFAEQHRMVVAMHGHSNLTDPNEFATPDSFAAAMKMSRFFKVNLDIGHFTAANFDAVAYIREHHADITNLHLKDRKRNQGATTVWGEGDAPIRDVLQLLKKERWPIRAYIEYEYAGTGSPVDEVKRCDAYARQALA
jgi:hypothetical protein